MRQIGTIPNEPDASRFGAFLLTLGMENTVEESTGGWAVWVEDDDQLERAAVELDKFRADPANPTYAVALGAAKRVRAEKDEAETRRRKNFIDVRTSVGKARQSVVPFTMLLVGICLVVAVFTRVWEGQRHRDEEPRLTNVLRIAPVTVEGRFMIWDGLDAVFKHGQVWRLVTPIFMHADLLHLLFNMLWMVQFGVMIETRKGTIFFVLLTLSVAVISNLSQYYWSGPNFLGMSGVNYGLFGYIWIKGRYDPGSGLGVNQQTVTIMLIWLVACMTGFLGNVANAVHFAGLVAGTVVAYGPYAVKRVRR